VARICVAKIIFLLFFEILGGVGLCYLFLLEAIFMFSKAEVMLCSCSTLITDNAVELENILLCVAHYLFRIT
jgi:hypothetical protein